MIKFTRNRRAASRQQAASKRGDVIPVSYTGITYPLYLEAVKQPHLLLAGCTGSGKSTVLHALIYTAILTEPQSRFIMIDPKSIELWRYTATKQCIYYASEAVGIMHALQYAEKILLHRFHTMRTSSQVKTSEPPVYIVIDEYADIVNAIDRDIKRECMRIIQRISQLGRAARIVLWIATQSPVSSVIDTRIKCNIDSRIGLRTRSKQDSRNIIEKAGLESLPRYGEGYYMSPETSGFVSIPMIQENAIQRLISHCRR